MTVYFDFYEFALQLMMIYLCVDHTSSGCVSTFVTELWYPWFRNILLYQSFHDNDRALDSDKPRFVVKDPYEI